MSRRVVTVAAAAVAVAVVLGAPALAPAAPAAGHADRVEYHDPTTPPSRGPTSAPVTIEIFFVPGLNMPANAMRLLHQLADRHPTRVRVVYRILKSGATLLAPSAALEAHAEGKFFEMMDELAHQRSALKKDDLLEIARRVGVDPQRVAQATQLEQYRDVLEDNQRRFERLHAATAPTVMFNAHQPKLLLGTATAGDFEREYEAAYARALDKLDRGFAASELAQAFDDEAMAATPPLVITLGALADEDEARSPAEHRLASPPLALEGLPSFGKPGARASVPIVVLCRPSDAACANLMRVVEPEARLYPDDVRIVWAPWFDVSRDDAAALTMLGDAALCAEAIGSNQGELTTSPGWLWVRETYAQTSRMRGKKLDAAKLIDTVASKLDVDPRALAACRARTSGATLDWVAAARRSGVPRAGSAIVIGGRIYDNLTEQAVIQALVEAELAPGVLGSLPRWER
ncbi:MAG TPA: hypothetical protein VFP84_21055 [Kofleriaceae bacterium]|nr:hypothetical protein [Kofleriaceae bacterium]